MTRKIKKLQGAEKINQIEHLDSAGSKIVTEGVLVPGDVITADASAAPRFVEEGSICRIETSAITYVAFGDDSLAVVGAGTSPALKLLASQVYLVVATADYIRSSVAFARLEVIAP